MSRLQPITTLTSSAIKPPEQVIVDYIELNPELFSATQNVAEEQVRARYEEQRESLESTTSRQAAHILLTQPSERTTS